MHKKRLLLFALLALATTGCDQLTKSLAARGLGQGGSISVVQHLWDFRYVENPGAAFNFLQNASEPWRSGLLIALGAGALTLLGIALKRAKNRWRATGL